RMVREFNTKLSELRGNLKTVPGLKRIAQDQLHALGLRKAELEGYTFRTPVQSEELLQVSADIESLTRRLANIGDEIAQKQRVIKDEIFALENQYKSIDQAELQKRLVTALTEERIAWYNKSRASLGALDSPEKVEKLTDIVAEFQRDLVSIHPFGNGNGRSTRQFALYYPLIKEGLPPPRILDPDTDLFKPLATWRQELKDGVFASQRLVTDLQERAYAGLPLEDSMELLRPVGDYKVNKPMFRVSNRKGAQEWFDGPEVTSIDRDQFNHYVKEVIEERPILLQGIESDPIRAWDEIHKLAEERYLRNNVFFDHRPKSGNNVIRDMSLGMPTDDFKNLFGRPSYDDPFTYNYKMDKWYNDEINWRGLATFKGRTVKGEDEILDMFRQLDPHMVSNDILGKRARDPEAIRKAALGNMDEMEKAIKMAPEETGDISDWAKWHSEATDPYYGRSIGYSTSKKESVGKAFGMGAMVNGKFGKVNKADKVSEYLLPERQARLAQRLNVGTRRSIKDVEIEWMRSLRDNFRYSYGQQREVMGIGAADPDAIMIIKSYDDEGKVIESFVRNPEKPHEIWIVKGDADPGVKPPKGSEYRTMDLRQPRAPASPE
ncbi:MAG: Fic family protein, partial [Halobacteriovoraceae bacterium]|nr:Fic family protein [Halobacteriovoraceae bacterium]